MAYLSFKLIYLYVKIDNIVTYILSIVKYYNI